MIGKTASAQYVVTTLSAEPPNSPVVDCNYIIFSGSVNTHGDTLIATFEWGLTTSYGNTVAAVPQIQISTTEHTFYSARRPVAPGTTYHVHAVCGNKNRVDVGADLTFTTCTNTTSVATLAAEGLAVYPNTITSNLTIDGGKRIDDLHYLIIDAGGHVTNLPFTKTGSKILVTTESLPSGHYWLQISLGDKVISTPLEKH